MLRGVNMGQQEKETASEKALGAKPPVQKGKRVRTSSPTALQPMANFSFSLFFNFRDVRSLL